MKDPAELFSLEGRVAVITGGTGFLGKQHAEIIARAKGIPVLADLAASHPKETAAVLAESWGAPVFGCEMDVTQVAEIERAQQELLTRFSHIDILINNAAHNPKVENFDDGSFSRLENFPLGRWRGDLDVGLTGAFLCCKIFGTAMAHRGRGVIVNIASDLSLISPDQRIYRRDGISEEQQPVKPITYSVIKTGLLGMTRYLATYWAERGVRVNAISPGGVENGQEEAFVHRLSRLIPLGRMAHANEYQGAILFLCSDASSYMTGTNLVVDGGRTCW
jgi:NAD(P)-dependent dehydrogenase (short-subunit alcohol dehydrogenase family)